MMKIHFIKKKLNKKANEHLHYKINPLKRHLFKIFLFNRKIKQFIVKLFFYYKIYYYFCSPF